MRPPPKPQRATVSASATGKNNSKIIFVCICICYEIHNYFENNFSLSVMPFGRPVREECQVSVEGRQYRRNLLRCFLPSLCTPRKKCRVALFCTFLLNGDWREQNQLIHICKGSSCCPRGVESTKEKLRAWLPALLRTLRPSQLNGGNWMDWSTPVVFLGLLQGIHGLLADMYRYAFSVPALDCRSPEASALLPFEWP